MHLSSRKQIFEAANSGTDLRDRFAANTLVSDLIRGTSQGMAKDLLAAQPLAGMASVRAGGQAVSNKMDFKTAVRAIDHKTLPADVQFW